jgi:cytochrome P450
MDLSEIDLTDLDLFVHGDPHRAWKTLRAQAPVYWHERKPGHGFWAITKYHDAQTVYRDPIRFSSASGIVLNASLAHESPDATASVAGESLEAAPSRRSLIATDPPRHREVREIINQRFTPRAILKLENSARAIISDVLDDMLRRRECDFVTDVVAKIPSATICEMIGVPREDWPLMFRFASMAGAPDEAAHQTDSSPLHTMRQTRSESFEYFAGLLKEKRKAPCDDLASILADACYNRAALTEVEALSNCFLLVGAGQETTRNSLSGSVLAMIEHPAQFAMLRSRPALMPTAVEELIRWISPVTHVMRTCTQDSILDGHHVRAGQKVVIWNASANRDEDVFPDADRLDLARAPNHHLGFGYGEHFCLGAHLARLELRVFLEEWIARNVDVKLTGVLERVRSNLPPASSGCRSGFEGGSDEASSERNRTRPAIHARKRLRSLKEVL